MIPGPIPQLMEEYGVYNHRNGLANPAVAIVDRNGRLRWLYVGRNDNDRPSVPTILGELRKLQ